jgi:hypothetical protein
VIRSFMEWQLQNRDAARKGSSNITRLYRASRVAHVCTGLRLFWSVLERSFFLAALDTADFTFAAVAAKPRTESFSAFRA